MGPQAVLDRRSDLYGIGAILECARPGLGVLILGYSVFQGVGIGPHDPAVYILTTLSFTIARLAGQGVRRDQRDGRHRRRCRPADRRPDHLGDQLAGRVPVPGRDRGDDHPARRGSSIRSRRTRRVRSTRSGRSCRPSACSSWSRNPAGRGQQHAACCVPRRRSRLPRRVLRLHPRPRASQEGAAALARACSRTERRTSG